MYVSSVKKSAKSVRSIEQRSAVAGRGLRAIPHRRHSCVFAWVSECQINGQDSSGVEADWLEQKRTGIDFYTRSYIDVARQPLRPASYREILFLLPFCRSAGYLFFAQPFIEGRRFLLFRMGIRLLFRLFSMMSSCRRMNCFSGTVLQYSSLRRRIETLLETTYIRYFHSFPHLYRCEWFSV
jgi:hypothetical protein